MDVSSLTDETQERPPHERPVEARRLHVHPREEIDVGHVVVDGAEEADVLAADGVAQLVERGRESGKGKIYKFEKTHSIS